MRLILAMVMVVLAGCAALTTTNVESIWLVGVGRIDRAAALERMAAARVVLLGETHDSSLHHALQLAVLRDLLRRGRRPAVVMEMFDEESQADIDRLLLSDTTSDTTSDPSERADRIASLTNFEQRGWEWRFYRPIVTLAMAHRLPIIASNLSRERAREVGRSGFASLATREPLPRAAVAPHHDAMRRALAAGHCDMLPPASIESMLRAQQARDATLAAAIDRALERAADGSAIVIAGSGHVRRDFGIPAYRDLRAAPVVSVGFLEATAGSGSVDRAADGPSAAFDITWYTARTERPDPCAAFKKQLPFTPPGS